MQKLGDEFAAETGIGVKVHQMPWASYQDQVFLNFGNKQTDFDIVVGDSQWMGRGAMRGLYLELTDWLPQHVDISCMHPMAQRYLMEYPAGCGLALRQGGLTALRSLSGRSLLGLAGNHVGDREAGGAVELEDAGLLLSDLLGML